MAITVCLNTVAATMNTMIILLLLCSYWHSAQATPERIIMKPDRIWCHDHCEKPESRVHDDRYAWMCRSICHEGPKAMILELQPEDFSEIANLQVIRSLYGVRCCLTFGMHQFTLI